MAVELDLDPAEFADTANAVMNDCARADGLAERACLLGSAGLLGVLAPEAVGGLGLPIRFAVPVLQAAGSRLLAYPLLEAMLLARELSDSKSAAAIVAGDWRPTIAWSGMLSDEGATIGRAPLGEQASHVLGFHADGGARLIEASSNVIEWMPAPSIDVLCPEANLIVSRVTGAESLSLEAVARLRRDADLLRAALILGHAQSCLEAAADHAEQREQFGRSLSANQAIRHRLARQSLAVETIRNAIARALNSEPKDERLAGWAAFAGACELGATVVESAIQIFGGMGFTWELPLHLHLRRIKTLAAQGDLPGVHSSVAKRLVESASHYRDGGMRDAG